jgi:hypothetical protein
VTRSRIRLSLFACVALALVAFVPTAHALGGCASGSASAIDQYCEQFPSATGGATPMGPGAPTLAATLPRRTVSRFLRSSGSATVGPAQLPFRTRNQLGVLSIPPYRHVPLFGSAAVAGGWPLLQTLALVLGAIIVMLIALALWRRRTRAEPGATGGA